MDFITEIIDFITTFISNCPDIFAYVFSFLTGIIVFIKDMFLSGQILIGVLIVFLLVKLVGIIRDVI